MGKITSTNKILDYAPNFYSGLASVLRPGRRNQQLRKAVRMMSQNDGLCADWNAIGGDFRMAITKFNAEMSWQRK